MTIDLKRKAVHHIVLKRNLFFSCSHLKIRNRYFSRSLSYRIMNNSIVQVSLRVAEAGVEIVSTIITITIGLTVGLILALLLSGITLGVAILIFNPDFSKGVSSLIFAQSWRDYVGSILVGLSLFILPYVLLGVPSYLALTFRRPIQSFFVKKRKLRELRCQNDNNDPELLKARLPTYRHAENDSYCIKLVEYSLLILGTILGALTGGLVGSLPLLIYLKIAALLWELGVLIVLLAIFGTFGLSLLIGLLTIFWFLRSFYAGGIAFGHFIKALFDNGSFFDSFGNAVHIYFEQTFEVDE